MNKIFGIFEKDLIVPLIVCVIIMIIAIFFIIIFSIRKHSTTDYEKIIIPDYHNEKTKDVFKTAEQIEADKKNKSLNGKIASVAKKKKFDQKVRRWYIRAGKYNSTIEDLISFELKMVLVGIASWLAIYVALGNPYYGLILSAFCLALPFISILSDIQERESKFRAEFPYFLKTLSFVLANGSNMAIAFRDCVERQSEGILKEVMNDVLVATKVNGGDFGSAFGSIINKIDCDETREFVDVVQSNLEKGVSIAEIFSVQSESIEKFITNKKRKKIKGISNKVLLPILIVIGAVALIIMV